MLDPGFEEARSNIIFQMSQISEIKSFTKSDYLYANLLHFEELEANEIKQKKICSEMVTLGALLETMAKIKRKRLSPRIAFIQ